MQVKLDNQIYECCTLMTQLSLGSHATITLIIDISNNWEYEKSIIKLYESRKIFELITTSSESQGAQIKTIDIDYTKKRIELLLHCDVLVPKNVLDRRNEIIDDILNKNF
jgi:hypothetical protein